MPHVEIQFWIGNCLQKNCSIWTLSTPTVFHLEEHGSNVLYSDNEGYIYAKMNGQNGRGYRTGFNTNVTPQIRYNN